jgi:chromosome segregation ATPase
LRRIFFTEGVDTSIAECDVSSLQNKIDSLTFQVRCAETEKKKIQEERDCLSARNVALAEEYRSLEQQKKHLKEELDGAKVTSKHLSSC